MNPLTAIFKSSLGKKYLMALSGLVLVGFVLVHMVGNLQVFLPAQVINEYAHKLHTLPPLVLWGFRLFLLLAVVVHVWTAILLVLENRRARPEQYADKGRIQSTLGSRTMRLSGAILAVFIVFHIFHFTVRTQITEDFGAERFYYLYEGVKYFNVHDMMVIGFENTAIALFYIIATGLLCLHLSHGASSMFQSIGFRNDRWRKHLDRIALAYGWFIFLGFASIPVAVQLGLLTREML